MSSPGNPSQNAATDADAPTTGVGVNGEENSLEMASDAAVSVIGASDDTASNTADSETVDSDSSETAIAPSPTPLDYPALARFLLEPLIDLSEDLQISSEVTAQNSKVSLRVSLGQGDRGRAFGRGGRNIRAIRTILRAAGQNAGQTVSLEIVGDESDGPVSRAKPKPRKAGEPRPSQSKPKPKPKPKSK